MRIAIVTETYPPEINGVALTVQALAQGLCGRGHAVQLIRPRQPQAGTDQIVGEDVQVRGAAIPRYPGLRFGLPARRRLERLWRAARPDAIYVATEGPLGHSALRAARRLGIAASTGFHTRFDDFARFYGLGWLTPAVFAWLRHFHAHSAATLVPTQELADFLAERGFSGVRLLRRAVDTQLFDPARRDEALRRGWGLTPDELAVVYVGRIAPEKNLALNVRAFRALQQHCPNARYVWIGDGPARAELAAANPDFVFTGPLRGENLAAARFVAGFLEPNCFFDEALTQQARARRTEPINVADRYEAGQTLVAKGEMITPPIKLALDELRARTEPDRVQAALTLERSKVEAEAAKAREIYCAGGIGLLPPPPGTSGKTPTERRAARLASTCARPRVAARAAPGPGALTRSNLRSGAPSRPRFFGSTLARAGVRHREGVQPWRSHTARSR